MEFHKTLQNLRKQKGLTQEELAASLFVSRAAVSKWESGRGTPNIDSLKAIAVFFDITIDDLLSGEELLTIAEEDSKHKQTHLCDLIFGLLDISTAMLFFLPFFGQQVNGITQSVSLLSLTTLAPYMKPAYIAAIIGCIAFGVLTLALQNCEASLWVRHKHTLSVLLHALAAVLFVISLQPYAATFLLILTAIKVFLLVKRP